MEVNFVVRNDVCNAKQKDYYFETISQAVDFAQFKCKRDKRNVRVMDCKLVDGLYVSTNTIYLIRYYNGGISRERA